jgi:hypothetical protein
MEISSNSSSPSSSSAKALKEQPKKSIAKANASCIKEEAYLFLILLEMILPGVLIVIPE